MNRLDGDDFQDQHVEGALQQLRVACHFLIIPRHSRYKKWRRHTRNLNVFIWKRARLAACGTSVGNRESKAAISCAIYLQGRLGRMRFRNRTGADSGPDAQALKLVPSSHLSRIVSSSPRYPLWSVCVIAESENLRFAGLRALPFAIFRRF